MATALINYSMHGNNVHNNSATANGFHNNHNSVTSNSTVNSSTTSNTSSSSNPYRIGDYIYIEASPNAPYQICKIEELIKNQNGNVEVKLIFFYRRRDISGSLIQQVEKHQSALVEDQEKELESLPEKEKHLVKLRELYLSPQIEVHPVSSIRGKCTVTLLSEAESLLSYLKRDDAFFYTQIYEPDQKTLVEADRGEIRVGQKYQAEVPTKPLDNPEEEDTRELKELESLSYNPDNQLSEEQIEQFLVVAKSVGTYARALDCSSSVKQSNLHMSAAAASRDVTTQYAMDVLHQCDYDFTKAVCSLVPNSGPVLCRDEIEEWSTAESSLFEEAYEKCEKRFDEIQQNFLPWKSMKSLIQYYYLWKTTDRYVQRKRVKAVENESKLKHVYVPNYNKQSAQIGIPHDPNVNRQCESCKKTSSSCWNPWGPSHYQYFLCQSCWNFWRKFGAFKTPNRVADMSAEKLQANSATTNSTNNSVRPPATDLNSQYPCRECNKVFNRQERLFSHMASHRPHKCNVTSCGKEFKLKAHLTRHCANSHGVAMRSGSPRPIMKTRAAFYFSAISSLQQARRICSDVLNLKRGARNPFMPLNLAAFKQEYSERFSKGVSKLPKLVKRNRGTVTDISHRLGTPKMPKPEWLIALPKDKLPQPERLAFPPVDNVTLDLTGKHMMDSKQPEAGKKRLLEQNGNSLPSKRRQLAPPSILGKSVPDLYENISRNSVSTQSLNGRAKIATFTNVSGKRQMISWVDAPDDVFFVSNTKIKQMRRRIPLAELLRAARQPYKQHYEYLSTLGKPSSTSSSTLQSSVVAGNAVSRNSQAPTSKLNPNAVAAAAALNLASITGQLSSNPAQQQQVQALLTQQMFAAQNLNPLLGANHNHLMSQNAFFNNLTNSSSNNSAGKLSR